MQASTTQYRKGKENGNADSLSQQTRPINHSAASTALLHDTKDIRQHQSKDPIISKILDSLQQSSSPPRSQAWHTSPYSRYRQLWNQLAVVDGIVYRRYTPGPASDSITVPLVPASLQQSFLQQLCHDSPQGGHLGADKSISWLRHLGYWVGMLQDVVCYCQLCTKARNQSHQHHQEPHVGFIIVTQVCMVLVNSFSTNRDTGQILYNFLTIIRPGKRVPARYQVYVRIHHRCINQGDYNYIASFHEKS